MRIFANWRQLTLTLEAQEVNAAQEVTAFLLWFLVQYLSNLHIWWTEKYKKVK